MATVFYEFTLFGMMTVIGDSQNNPFSEQNNHRIQSFERANNITVKSFNPMNKNYPHGSFGSMAMAYHNNNNRNWKDKYIAHVGLNSMVSRGFLPKTKTLDVFVQLRRWKWNETVQHISFMLSARNVGGCWWWWMVSNIQRTLFANNVIWKIIETLAVQSTTEICIFVIIVRAGLLWLKWFSTITILSTLHSRCLWCRSFIKIRYGNKGFLFDWYLRIKFEFQIQLFWNIKDLWKIPIFVWFPEKTTN